MAAKHQFTQLNRLRGLRFSAKSDDDSFPERNYIIERFVWNDATEQKVEIRFKQGQDPQRPEEHYKTITVADYFKRRYKYSLKFPKAPLIKCKGGKDTYIPAEIAIIHDGQSYNFKLDGDETSNMINFAVTNPKTRAENIQKCVQKLGWSSDQILKDYGVQIDTEFINTKAKLLPSPKVKFGGTGTGPNINVTPRHGTGKWDFRDKKFLVPNKAPLVSWGVGVVW
jgi:eukaryotic translation initiation factor 2C